jgi:diguanylate cyclase (GGDEF)-like protein
MQKAPRWSQLADTVFQNFNLESGLPNPAVLSLAVDGDGFLWAGTEDGLARWDGYRFRAYRSDPANPRALPDNSVFSMHTDARGRLWAGTNAGGLARYDREQDSFTVYGAGDKGLSSSAVLAIADDGHGGLWLGTGKGLDHLNPDTGAFTRQPLGVAAGGGEPVAVNAVLLDRHGNLWAGTSAGLLRRAAGADADAFTAVPLATADRHVPQVFALFEDRAGRLWVGTRNDGAFTVAAAGLAVAAVQANEPEGANLAVEFVHSFAEASPGLMWIGTDGHGIVALDTATGHSRWIRHSDSRASSLGHDTVQALLRDRSGLMWVGGVGGLGRGDPGQAAVLSIFGDASRPLGLSDKDVHAVHTTPDGRVWLGLVANGVDVLDPGGRRVASLRPDAGQPLAALPVARVVTITSTPSGDVYLGTTRGVYRTDLAARSVRRITLSASNPVMPVYGLHVVGDTLWAASIAEGLWRLDLKQGGPAQRVAQGQLTDERVWSIAPAPNGGLWVGSYNGLNLLDTASGKVEQIQPDPRDPQALSVGLIPSLLTDRKGRLWVGTVNGSVDVLEGRDAAGRPRFRRLAAGRPLKGAANQWLMDPAGRIWTSTDDGIAVFDPDSFAMRLLQRADGVAIRSYWAGAGDATGDGEVLFGGLGGLTVVRPKQLQNWHYVAPLVVTDVRVGGKPLPPGMFNGGGNPAPPLVVQPDANSLAVEFAALDYSDPQRNRYAYRLDGYDADWVETDWTRRVASYTNLSPGNYVLQLRGSNRNGDWSDKPLALALRVLPAWYQTLWFRAAAAVAAVLAAVLLVRSRTAFLRRRQQWLEAQVAQRTEELVAAHRELERIAYVDTLTLLPNRRMFNDSFHQQLALARRQGRQFAFALIDLDRFKEINDTRGHDVGDALLVAAAKRLQTAVRESDIVARIGGDEFAILLTEVDDPQRVESVCRRIVESFAEPAVVKGRAVSTSPSIGLSLYPKDGDTQERLFKAADLALYAAKREGRNTWRWYHRAQDSESAPSTIDGAI